VTVRDNGHATTRTLAGGEDPLSVVEAALASFQPVAPVHELVKGLPRFFGGAVGYLGYDMVRFFEQRPEGQTWISPPDDRDLPDMHLFITDTLVVFDHVQHRLLLFANAPTPAGCDLDAVYDAALARLDALEAQVRAPLAYTPAASAPADAPVTSTLTQAQYEDAVRRARSTSRRATFSRWCSRSGWRPTAAEPFSIYRALRRINPSPYMFFLDLAMLI
jgi:anthranilate synthase component 1